MAHGLSIENWKWYIKSTLTDASFCGPYSTEEAATAALERFGNPDNVLYIEQVNIAKLDVHPTLLPQSIKRGKLQPARRNEVGP